MGLNLTSLTQISSRVSSTAKALFKGSAKARQEMAALKTAEFFNSCEQDFFINGGVTKNQIEKTIKNLCPGVNVTVNNNFNESYLGAVGKIFNNNTISGFRLELPFSDSKLNVLTKDNIDTLMHEVRHLMDYAYSPKYTARTNSMSAYYKFDGYFFRSHKYAGFYDEQIYARNSENFGENLKNLFADKNITSPEKIEVLQKWRHRVKTEINAFSDGIKYDNKYKLNRKIDEINWGVKNIEKPDYAKKLTNEEYLQIYKQSVIESSESFEKRAQDITINEKFSLNEKLSKIEEMLGAEIKNERKNVATNLFLFGKPTRPI